MSVLPVTYKNQDLGMWNSDGTLYTYERRIPDETFITLLYNKVLNRAPDEGGFAYWTETLNNIKLQDPFFAESLARTEMTLQFFQAAQAENPYLNINKIILGDDTLVEATHLRTKDIDWNSSDIGVHLFNGALTAITSTYKNVLLKAADLEGVNFWYNVAKQLANINPFNPLSVNDIQNQAVKAIVEFVYPGIMVSPTTLMPSDNASPELIKGLKYVKMDIEHDFYYKNPLDPGNKSSTAESVLYASIAQMNQQSYDEAFIYPAGSIKDIPAINTYDDLIRENDGLLGMPTPIFAANHTVF